MKNCKKTSKPLSWHQLVEVIDNHNKINNISRQYEDKRPIKCFVVFKQESWPQAPKLYDLSERTYQFRSDEKYFIHGLCGNSIFANCLDGKDTGVRLDWYLFDWKIDYCYYEI